MNYDWARSVGQTPGHLQDEKMTQTVDTPSACGLFPLPQLPSLKMCRGLGRGASQRLGKKVRIREEQRETIAALNWMHTGDFDAQPAGAMSALQVEVLERVESMVELAGDLGDQCHLPSQEAALRELLRGQDGYAEPSVPASLAPFKLELISLPQDLRGAPRAEDLLPVEDRRYLEVQERMLCSVNSTGTTHSCIYAMHYVQICTIPALSLAQGKDLIVLICVRGKLKRER